MLYVRGANGTAIVRISRNSELDSLDCTILNNGTHVMVSRATDASLLAGILQLQNAIALITGPPTIVSGASELF